jgi:hypothetical protein
MMTLKLAKSTYATAHSARFYAQVVAHKSGVRHRVYKERDFWVAEPKGVVGYDLHV